MNILVEKEQYFDDNLQEMNEIDPVLVDVQANLGVKAKVIPPELQESILIQEMIQDYGKEKSSTVGEEGNEENCVIGNDSVEEQGVMVKCREKKCYSRDEMEAIRCMNVEEEKIIWNEIYVMMGTSVAKEYEELAASSKPKKQGGRGKKTDHITNKEENGLPKKKGNNVSTHGEVYNSHMEHNLKENILCEDLVGCANDVIMDSSIVEFECDEGIESDSEDEFDNIQRPAFAVEGDPDFNSGPPQDGLEFLRRVRWEAAQIPKVKVAKIDKSTVTSEQTVYMPIIPDIAKCPDHLLPTKDWEEAFLADFSELRQSLTLLDTLSEISSHPRKHININNEDLGTCSTEEPKLSTIIGMDVVSRASLLRNRIKSFEDKETLGRDDCVWLYALSAAIDTPFDADMGASLRCLLRKCAKLRSEKTEFDDEVIMLNILATVSGKYFGQSET
ncbi:hypothetical protein ACHQM5_011636 [Ranunculus cassubicifolius]